jgi:hypothetical protein
MRKLLFVSMLFALPVLAHADNVGGCGWGSKLLEGQKGVFGQSLAVTTNGSFGNQTFGITSGTSGCTQDGVVSSNWKTAMFIDGNRDRLARDMSVGGGETLDSLAHLIGVRDEDRGAFNRVVQENVSLIFPAGSTTEQAVVALRAVLGSSSELAQYAASV